MTRNRITRILAAGGASIIAICALPGTANAQFSPCALLGPAGAFIPPPCPKIDIKRLADLASQNANEIGKIQETVNTIQQAKTATQGIVSDARGLTKINISLPNVNTDAGPILQGIKGNVAGYATKMGEKMFAGSDGTVADAQSAVRNRQLIVADATVDAFAYGWQGTSETEAASVRYAALSKKTCKSADLRTDWSANSEIKLELMNARARQSYLYSTYLKLASAQGVVQSSTQGPKGFTPGTVVSQALGQVPQISKAAEVGKLTDLLAKSRSLMGSLSVVTMVASLSDTLKVDSDAYDSYVNFMESKKTYLLSRAGRWADEGDKCKSSTIVNAVLAGQSSTVDRCIDKKHKTEFYSTAYGQATVNNNYPETSPLHYNYQPGLDFYNVERTFRKEQLDQARADIAELQGKIAEENALQGGVVDSVSVTRDLSSIVAEANALGVQVTNGQDPGAKAQAADLLRQLKDLMAQGTGLPAVDVPTPGDGGTTPVGPQDPQDPGQIDNR